MWVTALERDLATTWVKIQVMLEEHEAASEEVQTANEEIRTRAESESGMMKEKMLSMFEAQKEMANLPEQLGVGKWSVVAVTYDGKPALAILSYHTYKKLLETISALQDTVAMCQDEEQMATLRNTLAELQCNME